MSFDARSLERLQQLGRSLPQALPKPPASSPAAPGADGATPPGPGSGGRRHRVETENDPQALFRELMQVSPDGHVPPHLMERLKQLESLQQAPGRAAQPETAQPTTSQRTGKRPGKQTGKQTGLGNANPRLAADHGDLYAAFQQLLLEDDDS
jgi:hypothetical protein